MNQSNINNHNVKPNEVEMDYFLSEMKRLSVGLEHQGKNIAKLANVHYSGYNRCLRGKGGKTTKGRNVLYRILQAAKALYREPLVSTS